MARGRMPSSPPSIILSTAEIPCPIASGDDILPSRGNDTTDWITGHRTRRLPRDLLGSSEFFQILRLQDDQGSSFARKELVDQTIREKQLRDNIDSLNRNTEMPKGRKRRQIQDFEAELEYMEERREQAGLILSEEGSVLVNMTHFHIIKLLKAPSAEPPHLDLDLYDLSMKQYLEQLQGGNDGSVREMLLSRLGCFAGAIAYVHHRGLLHVDIKPGNFLWRGDKICLTDFGSFRYLPGVGQRLGAALANGNRMYAAYEVLNGESNPSTASDVAGLGFCLIEFYTFICNDPDHPLETLRSHPPDSDERGHSNEYAAKLDWVQKEWLETLKNCSGLTTLEEHEHIKKELKRMIDKDSSERPDAKDLDFLHFSCNKCQGGSSESNSHSGNDVVQSGTWTSPERAICDDEIRSANSGSTHLGVPFVTSTRRESFRRLKTTRSQASAVPTLVDDMSSQSSCRGSETLASPGPPTPAPEARACALGDRVQPPDMHYTKNTELRDIHVRGSGGGGGDDDGDDGDGVPVEVDD